MPRLVGLLLMLLALASCGPADEGRDDEGRDDEADPETTEHGDGGQVGEGRGAYPLTGQPVDDAAALERPPLAVKIDNLAPARPQSGVEDADVVVVEPVEGATRLIALFHSRDPGEIGPVRSGRLLDADLLPPLQPVYAMSGAHGPVEEELRAALPVVISEGQSEGWRRSDERAAPHNLYVDTAGLWAAGDELPPASTAWTFADAPAGGSATASARITYPQAGSSGWVWSDEAERWLRLQDGGEHTATSGARLGGETVVVLEIAVTDDERLPIDLIGRGSATVLRDGRAFEASWQKASRDGHLEVLTPEGAAFPLAPGQSWIELLPASGELSLEPAAAEDDAAPEGDGG
ncbi:MAG: DUF3048 domain-containing protein [Egibacteraceae bacterium]